MSHQRRHDTNTYKLHGLLTALAAIILTCALAFSLTAKRVEGVRKHTRGSDE